MPTKVRPAVVGLGEVLWDLLPGGAQLGGAPANFAYHAQALGAQAHVVTRVGRDRLGEEVLQRFTALRLPVDTVQVDETQPTGTVSVTLNDEGVPQFAVRENVAWDQLVTTESAWQVVRRADAICFGSLAQRAPGSRDTIQRLVAAVPRESLRIFDVNLRHPFHSAAVVTQSLRLANVLKLNQDELALLTAPLGLSGNVRSQIETLATQFELKLVVLTCGSNGSLIHQEGRWSEQLFQPTQVVDTVGAGDAFTAALVMALWHKMDLSEAHAFAAEVARYVCTQAGATPSLPASFQKLLHGAAPDFKLR